MNSADGRTIASVQLASIELIGVLRASWRSTSDTLRRSYIQILLTICERVAKTGFSIKIYVDLRHRASLTVLTLIILTFLFALAECLLF